MTTDLEAAYALIGEAFPMPNGAHWLSRSDLRETARRLFDNEVARHPVNCRCVLEPAIEDASPELRALIAERSRPPRQWGQARFTVRRLKRGAKTWSGKTDRNPWKIRDTQRPGWLGRARRAELAWATIADIIAAEKR